MSSSSSMGVMRNILAIRPSRQPPSLSRNLIGLKGIGDGSECCTLNVASESRRLSSSRPRCLVCLSLMLAASKPTDGGNRKRQSITSL